MECLNTGAECYPPLCVCSLRSGKATDLLIRNRARSPENGRRSRGGVGCSSERSRLSSGREPTSHTTEARPLRGGPFLATVGFKGGCGPSLPIYQYVRGREEIRPSGMNLRSKWSEIPFSYLVVGEVAGRPDRPRRRLSSRETPRPASSRGYAGSQETSSM